MIAKNWHRDGKKLKAERRAPAKLKAVKQRTKALLKRLKTAA